VPGRGNDSKWDLLEHADFLQHGYIPISLGNHYSSGIHIHEVSAYSPILSFSPTLVEM